MNHTPTNYLSSYGKQFYGNCASLYNNTKDTCKDVAIRTIWKASHWGAYLGYQTGSTRLLNAMLEYQSGIPIAKMRVTDLHLAASLGTVADVKAAIDKGANVHARDWEGWTPLHFSAQTNGQGTDLLLAKGADTEAKNQGGNTPLHIAAERQNQEAVNSLLQAGANIEAKDKDGRTPLYLAVLNENKESIRALVAKGANIHAQNSKGSSPLSLALGKGRMDISALLHNVEGHPAFNSPETLHVYFEKMFPPSRNQLPKDLKWLEKMKWQLDAGKSPFEELGSLFEKCGPISFEENGKILQMHKSNSSTSPSLEVILNCTLQHSPLFAKALELANQHKALRIIEVIQDPLSKMPPAYCDFDKHEICIASHLGVNCKITALIWETLNVLQAKRFLEIKKLAEAGMLSREEFAVLTEYCEADTAIWHDRIRGEKNNPFPHLTDFFQHWKKMNRPLLLGGGSKEMIHTDFFRRQWDQFYGFTYLRKHSVKFQPQPSHA